LKTSYKRYKVKKLFIIGAGASRAVSTENRKAPFDDEFCKEIIDLEVVRPSWVEDSKKIICEKWGYPSEFSEMGLEEAILRQMSHLEFLDAIHKKRKPTSINASSYLNHVSHIITFILRRANENSGNLYKKFVSKYFNETEASKVKNRIITFNYDDLLDKYFIKKFSLQEVCFDRIKQSRDAPSRRSENFDNPLIIKLHGSVNWRCKTSDFNRIIDSKYRAKSKDSFIDIWYAEKGYPSPSDSVSPFIIPPLNTKPITEIGMLKYLWTKAYEYLHEAKELIICGYSLPNTDRLAYSMFSNFTNKSISKVTIVDPNTAVLGKWKELFNRNNIEIKEWVWVSDFYDYVENNSV